MEGAPLGDVLKRRIFDPLGMKDTGFTFPLENQQRRAKAYGFDDAGQLCLRVTGPGDSFLPERPEAMAYVSGGQGLWSTLDDYLTFARMFLNAGTVNDYRLLKPETFTRMVTNCLSENQLTNARSMLNTGHGFGLGVAMVLDLTSAGYALWNSRDRAALALRAPEVRGIEAAQTMAVRIEQLSERQQRPLEWLSAIGTARPRSVQFTRVVGRNDRTLEIEAQTTNANDVGVFETALRKLPNLDHVEIRDLRAREGMTSFVVALAFKPVAAAAAAAEGQP
jgi:CubicO group peptidase (beta-lactamase class C family)